MASIVILTTVGRKNLILNMQNKGIPRRLDSLTRNDTLVILRRGAPKNLSQSECHSERLCHEESLPKKVSGMRSLTYVRDDKHVILNVA